MREKRMAEKQLVGFIGVGVMGQPMARRLIEKGYALLVNDSNPAMVASLVALGARAAASARALADEAEIVFTSLPSPAIYRTVALGAEGVAHGKAVKVMVDLSTVGSIAAKEVAAGLLAKGIELVDAPVSGGAAGAQKGTLAVMASGKAAAVAAARPMLETFGKLFVVSEVPGQAQLLKLLNNMLSSTAVAITSEAYVAGIKGGLDPEVMMNVFNAGSGRNSATADKFPKYVLSGSFDFGFPISSVCKDIGLAVDECQALGVPMSLGGQARQLWQSAFQQGGAPQDMTRLVEFVERWSADVSKPKS
jgi:2-hydroxy-3-oxopropionate reductase